MQNFKWSFVSSDDTKQGTKFESEEEAKGTKRWRKEAEQQPEVQKGKEGRQKK